jgi:hypothetical protein
LIRSRLDGPKEEYCDVSKEKMEVIEKRPKLDWSIENTGETFATKAAGNILEIQYHRLTFKETGQSYVTKAKTISPPSGWRRMSVSVADYDLSYGHATYEKALVAHVAAMAGARLSGSTLEVTATALIREPTSVPVRKWAGDVNVQAIFIG